MKTQVVFKERMLPELLLFEAGEEREQMVRKVYDKIRFPVFLYKVFYFLAVLYVGIFLLPNRLMMSGSGSIIALAMCLGFLGDKSLITLLFRRSNRRFIREELVKTGIPICVPCGYDLTGNESGKCPECGKVTNLT